MRTVLLTVSLVALGIAKSLADPMEDVRSCSGEPSPTKRLACYDAIAKTIKDSEKLAAPADPASAEGIDRAGVWILSTSKSAIDDSSVVSAFNEPDSDQTAAFRSKKPSAIMIRCKEKATDLMVVASSFLGSDIDNHGVKVVYRINKDAAVTAKWTASTDGKAAFFPGSPIKFLRSLPAQGQLVIRTYDFQGAYGETTFDLDGIDRVRSVISSACKWPAPKP